MVAPRSKGLFFLFLAAILSTGARAQVSEIDVAGTITDGASGAPVASALISVLDDASGDTLAAGVYSDMEGRYRITFAAEVAVQDDELPGDYRLHDVYPNPMAAGTITLRYETPGDRPEVPTLEIYDLLGRRLPHVDVLAAGVYFVRLRFAHDRVTPAKRFVVTRGGSVDLQLHQLRAPASSLGPAKMRSAQNQSAVERTADKHSATTRSAGKQLAGEVLFVVEKPGFARLESRVSLSSSQPNIADFALDREGTGRARLAVRVTSPSGELLTDVLAHVVDDTLSATTNEFGEAVLDSVYKAVPVVVRLTKDGFNAHVVRTEIRADRDVQLVEAVMRPRETAVAITNVEQGGEAVGTDGVRVTLPPNALVDADGNPVTGTVDAFLTPLNVTAEGGLEAFPGTFAGYVPDGSLKLILTLGVTDIVLEQGGAELNLADGQTATIELPLYVQRNEHGDLLQEGDIIPLWSLDEGTGLWTQETLGTVVPSTESPTGLALRGEVTHFSSWNCDVAADAARASIYTDPTYHGTASEFTGRTLDPSLPGFYELDLGMAVGSANTGVEGSRFTTFLPPDTPVELSIRTGARVGSDGLEVCRWSEIVTAEASSELDIQAEFTCEPLDTGGDNELLQPPTLVERAIDPAGEIDTYLVESEAGNAAVVTVCRSGPTSALVGHVTLQAPSGLTVARSDFGAFCGNLTFEMSEAGLYTVFVDGTFNEPEAYELLVDTGPLRALDSPVPGGFDGEGDVLRHFFRPDPGDVVSVSYGSNNVDGSVTGSVRLYEEGINVAHLSAGSGRYGQTTFIAEEDRPYVLELEPGAGVTGDYLVTAASLKQPTPFTLDGTLTQRTGTIDFFGQRRFFAFHGEKGRLLNIALDLTDARTQLTVKRPSQHFYDQISHANVAHEADADELDTGAFLLTETGDWVVELSHPSRAFPGLDALLGSFAFRVYAPETNALTTDSTFAASIDDPRDFDAYAFTLATESNIVVRTTLASGGRVVPRLLDETGGQLAQTLVLNPGDSKELSGQLPAGTYYLVLEPVDAALDYELELSVSG